MRKFLLPVCAGLVLISGALSAILWNKLSAERGLTANLRHQLAEAISRVHATPAPVADAVIAPPVTVSKPAPAANTATTSAAPKTLPPPGTAGAQAKARQEAELLKDPEYRKARQAQVRMNLQMQFIGFSDEMGISEKEAGRILDKLAELQLAMVAELNALAADAKTDPAARREFERRQSELQKERIAAVSAFLGPRYAQFQQYEKTLPARSEVASINNLLSQANQALSSVQIKAVTATMIAEQQRMQQERDTLTRDAATMDAEARANAAMEFRKRNEDSGHRMLDLLAPTLTAQQLTILRTNLEQSEAISRAQQRMQTQSQP